MSSLAKSKKGFKKLETLEMVELNGSENCVVESDSETELLDLTTPVKGLRVRPKRSSTYYSCGSCCCWCGVLYLGILTLFTLIVGVVSAYALTTAWQLSLTLNDTQQPLKDEISALKKELKSREQQTAYTLDGVQQTMYTVNLSFSAMNVTMWRKMNGTLQRLAKLETQISKSEQEDEEAKVFVMKQLAVLNTYLNASLTNMNAVRQRIDSYQKIVDALSNSMKSLSRDNGDVIHGNTDMQDSIQGFGDRILKFESQIAAMEKNVTEDHVRLLQMSHDLSSNVTMLQSLLSSLNSSLEDEVDHLWSNLSTTRQVLQQLQAKVSSIKVFPEGHTEDPSTHSSTAEEKETTVPPPIATATTESAKAEESAPVTSATSEGHQESSTVLSELSSTEPSVTAPPTQSNGLAPHTASTTAGSVTAATRETGSARGSVATSATASERLEGAMSGITATTAGLVFNGGLPGATDDGENDGPDVKNGHDAEDIDVVRNGHARNTLIEMLNSFNFLDSSGDGQLDFDEFSVFTKSEKVFKLIDFNHDGFVDKDELTHVISLLARTETSTQEATPSATPNNVMHNRPVKSKR